MRQTKSYGLHVNTAWQQSVFGCYFVGAPARLPDAVAEFLDDVVEFPDAVCRQPDNDHRRRDKHDVFTEDGPSLLRTPI